MSTTILLPPPITIPLNAPVITSIPNATLTAEQALSLLTPGLLKNIAGTLSAGIPDTDFIAPYTSQTASFALIAPTAGGTPTFRALVAADLTSALASPPTIGGTAPAAITGTVVTGTTGVFTTSIKTPIIIPSGDSTTAIRITKADGSTNVGVWDTTNSRLGINVTPSVPLHAVVSDAGTTSKPIAVIVGHHTSGIPAPGFGVSLEFRGHTSGTGGAANKSMFSMVSEWVVSNDATATALTRFYGALAGTTYAAGSEFMQFSSAGGSVKWCVFTGNGGAGAVVKQEYAIGFTNIPRAAFTATPASLGLAATLADLNLLRLTVEDIRAAFAFWYQASQDYGFMSVGGID